MAYKSTGVVNWYRTGDFSDGIKPKKSMKINEAFKNQAMNMKSRINLGKYKSFPKYSKDIFKTSLITSFPEIATSRSCTKRLIKIVVFVICVIGFTYQTLDFLKIYFAYPTVVNVHITNPYEVEQPAITFCNNNRRRRIFVCTLPDNQCSNVLREVFCDMYPRFCPSKDLAKIFPMMPYLNDVLETEFDWVYTSEECHNESLIKECKKEVEGKTQYCELPYRKVPAVTATGEPNFCYTVESQWGIPDAMPTLYPNTFSFEFDIRTQPEEYMVYTAPVLARIVIHDRKAYINPYTDGYALKGGVEYDAYVSMTTQELLPYPYDTNCTDYLKLWRENNGTGPLNDLMCVEQCKLNTLLEKGLCIDKNVAYPHTEQLCEKNKLSLTLDVIVDCYKQCQRPCRDDTYDVRYDAINNFDHTCSAEDEWCKVMRAKVNLIFKKFRHTKFVYQPKFANVEMFSYVGGYMGMWLGLSLISLFDLFETFAYLMFYPVGRMARAQRKKKIMAASNKKGKSIYDNLGTLY